jgi:hypothetical protein
LPITLLFGDVFTPHSQNATQGSAKLAFNTYLLQNSLTMSGSFTLAINLLQLLLYLLFNCHART